MRIDHDTYFLKVAQTVALRSPCLSRQVGCVLVDSQNHIMSTGYNGVPRNIEHCQYCQREGKDSGRDLYECLAVHAEQNALLQCSDVNKIKVAYITCSPCEICLRLLMNTSTECLVFSEIYQGKSWELIGKLWTKRLCRTYRRIELPV